MLKKLCNWWNTVKYATGWYVRPTMRIVFLNEKEIEVTPKTFSLVLDDAPACNWQWWVKNGVLLNRYPLSAIQEVDVIDIEIIAIKYHQSPIDMLRHDFATKAEIERKISEKVFEKA